ncbi:undecaprenyl-diphosphate phosphatase [Patescibacteria group bacterium]|nr:undecaprenyl-diphosphate phosphatase [Patescibacteria group bacterium]
MTWWHSIILGVVEGITEFLPISSTGHLILVGQWLKLPASEFLKSYEIVIQLGAILAVVVLYWRRLLLNWETIKKLAVAFVPTAVLGLVFYKFIKAYLLGNSLVVLVALFLGGCGLIVFEKIYQTKEIKKIAEDNVSYRQALWIGLAQSLAMVPGVSRAAATIVGGLAVGLPRKTIVEFSFLLAVPTMVAATLWDLLKSDWWLISQQVDVLLIGLVVSFIVALLAIKFLLKYIQNHNFIIFGIYRMILSLLLGYLMFF